MSEREQFEAWAKEFSPETPLWQDNCGQYVYWSSEWTAWQAARAQPAQAGQWLPIETAPKDFVTDFDAWNGERVPNVSWAHPEYSPKGHFDWCVSEYETGHGWVNVAVKNLTHWMPLPPPPGIVGGKGGAT